MKNHIKKALLFLTLISSVIICAACGNNAKSTETIAEETTKKEVEFVENDKDIVVVFTNDIHCAIEDNIGYAGLQYYYNGIKKQDVYPLLVDAGDFSQGAPIGTLSKGKHITAIMNKIGYNFAVPGNHEFDYDMQGFKNIVSEINNIICSSNLMDLTTNTHMLNPYKIFTLGNKKVAFVGVTSPMTFISSTPVYFQDENGNYIYGFCEDETGEALYKNVQESVDSAKQEGADYVVLVGHLGIEGSVEKWNVLSVLKNTNGIDCCIDGHSHEKYELETTNKDGKVIKVAQAGEKLKNIGKLTITKNGEFNFELVDNVLPLEGESPTITENGNAIDDDLNAFIQNIKSQYEEMLNEVIYKDNKVEFVVKDLSTGDRIVRKQETNLGDLCADAYREILEADIGIINGGGIRDSINVGDITYNDCMKIMPFSNLACTAKVSGQVILDALEWGAKKCPEENGGFLQVSGMTFTIDTTIPSSCKSDDKENFISIDGERRIKDVKINGEDIDVNKEYILATYNYPLKNYGDGFTMFKGCEIIKDCIMIDNEVLAEYIKKINTDEYANPYGEGRINIIIE